MFLFTRLLLAVACAALLQTGCEARLPIVNRSQGNVAHIALGRISGYTLTVELPAMEVGSNPKIVKFPDHCMVQGMVLMGIHVKATNKFGASPPQLSADNVENPHTPLKIRCKPSKAIGGGCPGGVLVNSYQFCSQLMTPIVAPIDDVRNI